MAAQPIDYSTYTRLPTRAVSHIPGDAGMPILGDTLRFVRDFAGLTQDKYRRYGPVFRANAFFQDIIVLLGPEANAAVLKDTDKCLSNALAWNPMLDKIFPNGLMLKDFDEHKLHRRVLQAAFKRPAIASYVGAMAPQIANGIAGWPCGREFRFFDYIKQMLLEVAAGVFLGLRVSGEAAQMNAAFIAAVDATLAVVKLPIPGNRWWRGQRGRAFLETFMRRHIAAKRNSDDTDIFAEVCRTRTEDGQYFSDQAVIDHLIFLLFAAHDTTTSTLCSMIYALAKHPQWQAALREEILAVEGESPGLDSLNNLHHTALVFREALRMYPPLPTIPRRCLRETQLLGYRIPRNAGVGISPLFTHYMEEHWDAPTRFDPLRFAPGRAEDKRHPYQFVPFGGGAHKCLGLHFAEVQTKLFLQQFLRRYEVSVTPAYSMAYSVVPLSLPTDGLPVSLRAIA